MPWRSLRAVAACDARRAASGRRRPASIPTIRIWTDDDKRCIDAGGVKEHEDTNGYDFADHTFAKPGERRDVRALNVNTLDEVPDSSWFTNRIGRRPMSLDELVRGPDQRERSRSTAGSVSAARAPACSRASA